MYQEEFLKLPDLSFVAQKVQKMREETFKTLKPHKLLQAAQLVDSTSRPFFGTRNQNKTY